MNKDQIKYLKSLDPNGTDGTIQAVLMAENLEQASFENALKFLLEATLRERVFLVQQNIQLSNSTKELPV